MNINCDTPQKIKEAIEALNNPQFYNEQLTKSLINCHFVGVHSIWITPTIRCFITENDVDDVNVFDNAAPHSNNERFLIHNHRYGLTSIPLEGHQENILFEEVPTITNEIKNDTNIGLYRKFKFYSAILNPDKEIKYEDQGKIWLKRISYTVNKSWFMNKEDIHRICWKGPIIALLIEHRDPSYINYDSTDAYLVDSAARLPCDEDKLYKPMDSQTFNRLTTRIRKSLHRYLHHKID